MASLIAEPQEMRGRSLANPIALDESATLEFKSTLQWDVAQNQPDNQLRHAVIKTVAAFINSEGGTLLIDADDDKNVSGLDQELEVLDGSLDRFGQLLGSLVADHIGTQYARFIKLRAEGVNGEQVCLADVDKASEPAFVKGPRGREFCVRSGNATRSLDPEEAVRYIDASWGEEPFAPTQRPR